MAIENRKLCEKDLDIFIEMRINQLREEGAKEDIDLKPALRDYYIRHMKDGTFVSWIAVDDEKIILKKYEPADIFTGSMDDLIEYQGKKVSKESILEMARIANLKISE